MTADIIEKVREIALGIKACMRVERLKACPKTVSQQVINDCDEILAALEAMQPTTTDRAEALAALDDIEKYAASYCLDERDSADNCVCGERQHKEAVAMFDAIEKLRAALTSAPIKGE